MYLMIAASFRASLMFLVLPFSTPVGSEEYWKAAGRPETSPRARKREYTEHERQLCLLGVVFRPE